MKTRVEQSDLNAALGWLAGIVPQRAYLPALSGIRCEAADGHLTLQATDLERAGTVRLPAAVDEPGATLVSAGLFGAIAGKLPAGTATIVVEDAAISLQGGRVRASVPTLRLDDFPQLPDADDGITFTLAGDVAEAIAKRVAVAAETSDAKPFLTGVNLIVADGRLTASATDSYRWHRLDVDVDADGDADMLVPAVVFAQVARMGGDVEVTIADGFVQFRCGDTTLTTKPTPGQHPHPDQFFPPTDVPPVTFDRAELQTSLSRCMAVAPARHNVPVQFTFDEGTVELAIGGGDFGKVIDVVEVDGMSENVQLSPSYLAGAVAACVGDQVTLRVDALKPVRVDGVGDDTFRSIVMPIR